MNIFDLFENLISFTQSPLVEWIVKGSLIYIAVLWLAVVIWVARDIIERSNSLIFQVLMIGINIVLPVFGLLVYLIIRPSKTLLERYYEELEVKVLTEQQDEEKKCHRCDEHLRTEFIFCPGCQEKLKNVCKHCKQHFGCEYKICPFCGKKQTEKSKKEKGES